VIESPLSQGLIDLQAIARVVCSRYHVMIQNR